MSRKIALVILAAGESKRMGQPKQLLPWGSNSLINHVVQETLKVPYAGYFVVLGANSELIKAQLTSGIQVIDNPNWKSGMGSSISMATIQLKTEFDAIQFVVVDQPQVDGMFLRFMSHVFLHQRRSLVATKYSDSIGIPALFDQKYFSELEKLSDTGAKQILEHHQADLKAIKPAKPLHDMDTPKEYQSLHQECWGTAAPVNFSE